MNRSDPQRERESYKYWRGLSLARLALELADGNSTINLDGNPVHFIDNYNYAFNTAHDISSGGRVTQTQKDVCDRISQTIGIDFSYRQPHSSLVVAYANDNAHEVPSTYGLCHGVQLHGHLRDLDPSSQEFIEDYFQVKIPEDTLARYLSKTSENAISRGDTSSVLPERRFSVSVSRLVDDVALEYYTDRRTTGDLRDFDIFKNPL